MDTLRHLNGKLTEEDLNMFAALGIGPELLVRAGVERVTDQEARHRFWFNVSERSLVEFLERHRESAMTPAGGVR